MLRKLAAVLLLIGLCTPYSCDVRPVTLLVPKSGADPWSLPASMIPVLAAIGYVALSLLPGAAAWAGRRAAPIRRLLAVFFVVTAAAWIGGIVGDSRGRNHVDVSDWTMLAVGLTWSGSLMLWTRRRGAGADPVPLMLLAIVGLAAVFCVYPPSELRYGGWILTSGYLLAVLAEYRTFAGASGEQPGGAIASRPGAG